MAPEDLNTLYAWLRQESPSRSPDRVNKMAALVRQAAGSTLLSCEQIPGSSGFGDTLVLRGGPRNGKKCALLIGHLDTVHPLGTVNEKMPVRVDGDRLYGPGVYDMKGGLLMGLRAAQSVLAEGTLDRPLIFVLSPDEEMGSPTSRPVIETFARDAAYALVLEPAREDGSCVTCRKGVGRFEISVEGIAAHAGVRHNAGRSAIAEAAHQILKIEALTDYAGGVTTAVGLVSGGTAANTIPQHCTFSVDFRAPTPESCAATAKAINDLEAVIPGTRLFKKGGVNRPPFERSPATADLFHQARSLASKAGIALKEAPQTGGGSDGNFTAALGVPTLDALGVDGAGAHTLQEYMTLSTFEKRTALIAGLLRNVRNF